MSRFAIEAIPHSSLIFKVECFSFVTRILERLKPCSSSSASSLFHSEASAKYDQVSVHLMIKYSDWILYSRFAIYLKILYLLILKAPCFEALLVSFDPFCVWTTYRRIQSSLTLFLVSRLLLTVC